MKLYITILSLILCVSPIFATLQDDDVLMDCYDFNQLTDRLPQVVYNVYVMRVIVSNNDFVCGRTAFNDTTMYMAVAKQTDMHDGRLILIKDRHRKDQLLELTFILSDGHLIRISPTGIEEHKKMSEAQYHDIRHTFIEVLNSLD